MSLSEPVDEVPLVFNSSALHLFHESDTIKYKVHFTGVAQSDRSVGLTFSQPLNVFVHVRALPSIQMSSLFLIDGDNGKYSGGDILEGSDVAVRIDARDEDDKDISDKSKITPIVIWRKDNGPEKKLALRYQSESRYFSSFSWQVSPGAYTLWVSAVEVELETGSQEYFLKGSVPEGGSKCGFLQELPTRSTPCLFTVVAREVTETDLNVVLGGLVGVVAAACVGLLLFYLRKHPKKAMKALCLYCIPCMLVYFHG